LYKRISTCINCQFIIIQADVKRFTIEMWQPKTNVKMHQIEIQARGSNYHCKPYFFHLIILPLRFFQVIEDTYSLFGLTYLSLFTCISYCDCSEELIKTAYAIVHKLSSAYFHKFSKIAFKNSLYKNNLTLFYILL